MYTGQARGAPAIEGASPLRARGAPDIEGLRPYEDWLCQYFYPLSIPNKKTNLLKEIRKSIGNPPRTRGVFDSGLGGFTNDKSRGARQTAAQTLSKR